jgi:hypothetical protein
MDDYDRRLAQAQDWAAGWQKRALSAEAERDRLRATIRGALVDARAARDAMNEPEDCFASVIEERLGQFDGSAEATDG